MKDNSKYIIWDIEVQHGPDETTGGWNNPEGMLLASAVVWDYATMRYHFYLHEESKTDLLNHLKGRICVGFNSVHFDTRVILGNDTHIAFADGIYLTNSKNIILKHTDLLLMYIQKYYNTQSDWEYIEPILHLPEVHDGTFTLDALCRATFGERKCGSGANAPNLYRRKKYDELLEYNLQDVRLTKRLFEFITKQKYVLNGKGQKIYL